MASDVETIIVRIAEIMISELKLEDVTPEHLRSGYRSRG